MEWADGCTLCWVHNPSHPSMHAQPQFTWHNGQPLAHSIVHNKPPRAGAPVAVGSWVAAGSLWPTFTSILTFTHRHQSLQGEFQGPDPTQKAYLLLVHAMVQSELESQSKIFLWKSWLTGRPRDQASPRLSGRILVIGNRFWGSHSCTFVGLSKVACVVVC